MPFYKSLNLPLKLDIQHFSEGNPEGGTDPAGGSDPDPTDPAPKTYDEAYVKKLRDEAAKYRTKAKELETNSQSKQQEMMKKVFEMFGLELDPNKEFEKQLADAQSKALEAERKANDKLIRLEIKSLGVDLGLIDPDAAYLLVNKDGFKVNDDGSIEGVKEALEQLLQEKPYLKRSSEPVDPEPTNKPNQYTPGSSQKGNGSKVTESQRFARGAERAKQRHGGNK